MDDWRDILKTAVTAANPHTTESSANPPFERGLNLLAAGSSAEAAQAFGVAIAADPGHAEAYHGLIRALRDAGQFEQSIATARALTALTPGDPLAHTALSISLQVGGHVPEAEAAAARARVLEWKMQLQFPPGEDTLP